MSSSDDDDDDSLELETLNISNDKFYQPKSGSIIKSRSVSRKLNIPTYGSPTIQHSLPAYDLWRPFYPTYMSQARFQNFHRPKLRHYSSGPQARIARRKPKFFPVKNLTASIYAHQKGLRRNVIKAINANMSRDEIINKFLLIRRARELTAKHGELFFFEYSEEFPPVLNQIGMASNIRTYQQKTTSTPRMIELTAVIEEPSIGYTEVISQNGPTKPIYYGNIKSKMTMIENNLFRAPIYKHDMPVCDFLIIRTRHSIYIREVPTIFTVGQMMPLCAIPKPNELNITKFRLDLSNTYIHKLFINSPSIPPTISFEQLTRLFPDYDPKVLKRRLTMQGAEQQLIEGKCRYNAGTSKYGLISLIDHRRSFTPEYYCINMAMLAARQRLRELNYSESMIDPPIDVELEPEVLAAPWNTSRAVLNASMSRCFLDLKKHLIDPTGPKREGFSCVPWSRSPTEEQQSKQKSEIWNQDYTESVELKNPHLATIKREKLERLAIYQREAQLITDVQNSVLSSCEILSSDDEEEEEEDDDEEDGIMDSSFDDQLNLLNKLVDGQSYQDVNHEREEAERREMLRDFNNIENSPVKPLKSSQEKRSKDNSVNVGAFKDKILRITRTYESDEGPIERTEIVRDPKIIALYVKKKGGSVDASQAYNNDKVHNSFISDSQLSFDGKRRSSISLGPRELCRADGIVLTISKKVLNSRTLRKQKRDSKLRIQPV